MGSMSDFFASSMAFSALPPMPTPSIPGGHQPAPISGTISNTQSATESDGFSMANMDLFSEPPPLAATVMSSLSPGTNSVWITAGVLSRVLPRLNAGSATMEARSLLSGFKIGAAHAFVDHGRKIERRLPAHAHAHLDEHHHDAGVLADRPMSFGAHARVGENLRDGIARRRALLDVVGTAHGADEIGRVIVGDVLQGVRNARNHIGFANHGHGCTETRLGRKSIKLWASMGSESPTIA